MKEDFPVATRAEYLSGDVTPKIRATLRRTRLDFGDVLIHMNDEAVIDDVLDPLVIETGYYVGAFQEPASIGTQSITAPGFHPTVLLILGVHQAVPGTAQNHHVCLYGMACRDSVGTIYQSCTSWSGEHGAAYNAMDSRMRLVDTAVINTYYWDASTLNVASLLSFDSTGFTLDWSVVSGSEVYLGYVAFGSSDIANAVIHQWLSRGSVGTKAITGVGFQPEFILNMGGGIFNALTGQRTTAYAGLGAKHSSYEFSVGDSMGHQYSLGPKGNSHNWSTNFHSLATPVGIPSTRTRIDCQSLDADGFTINEAVSPSFVYGHHALCLDGGPASLNMGYWTNGGGSPASFSVTGVGFQPDIVLFFGHKGILDAWWNSQGQMGLGMMDSNGNQFAVCGASNNDTTPSVATRVCHTDKCFTIMAPDGTFQQQYAFKSMDVDGFSLYGYYNDAGHLYPFFYIAIKVAS